MGPLGENLVTLMEGEVPEGRMIDDCLIWHDPA